MLGVIGIILGIFTLIFLVFKQFNPIISTTVAALIVGLTNGLTPWEAWVDNYAVGATDFFGTLMFVFIFASIYSKVMADSGCATSIAYQMMDWFGKERIVLVLGLTTAVLTYGGVSNFVVIFAVMPIAIVLLRELNLSKRILPGIIAWGGITFTLTAMPGTPQINNLIPTTYLGTTPTAAPVLGLTASAIMIVGGYLFLNHKVKQMLAAGLTFDESTVREEHLVHIDRETLPASWKGFLPLVVLMGIYIPLSNGWITGVKWDVYDAVNTAMVIAILVVYVTNPTRFSALNNAVKKGSMDWVMPLMSLCAVIGFGAVVKATPGFQIFVDFATGINAPTYVSVALSADIIAGITGSASGGITIALEALAAAWLATGANPAVMHRIAMVASGCLDSLPHAGGQMINFQVINENYKDAYWPVCFVSVIMPTIATVVIVIMALCGIEC